MIEIRYQTGEGIALRIEGEEYALIRKGDLPVKQLRAVGRKYVQMQDSMKAGDMDSAITAMITSITLFSTVPPDVLENLTMGQLVQIVSVFNESDGPAGADGANPT